jgi:hypothetical protein
LPNEMRHLAKRPDVPLLLDPHIWSGMTVQDTICQTIRSEASAQHNHASCGLFPTFVGWDCPIGVRKAPSGLRLLTFVRGDQLADSTRATTKGHTLSSFYAL